MDERETRFLPLKEEHRSAIFQNRKTRIYETAKQEVAGNLRKLHIE
jgi:hypothetical protein